MAAPASLPRGHPTRPKLKTTQNILTATLGAITDAKTKGSRPRIVLSLLPILENPIPDRVPPKGRGPGRTPGPSGGRDPALMREDYTKTCYYSVERRENTRG